jgi:anti-sigma-K factor RskA
MTNDAQLDHVDMETLALFAMRALDAEEFARIQAHVDDCAACRLEVQKVRGDMGLLAIGESNLVQPPARSKARLMATIQQEKLVTKPRSASLWKWAFAFSSALALLLIALLLLQHREVRTLHDAIANLRTNLQHERAESEQARQIAELLKSSTSSRFTLVSSKSRPQPEAHTTYDQDKGRVLLVANNMTPLPSEKTYELWLLPKSGAVPIPAGLFKPDPNGNAQMLYAELPSGTEAKGFAITVEPIQGSPAPTTTPLLVGLAKS